MKRFYLAVVCAVALFASTPAQAAPIITTADDGLTSAVVFDALGNPVFFAGITGVTIVTVSDGGPPTALGVVAAADADTGLFIELPTGDDILAFDFLFGTSSFSPTGVWTLAAVGAPLVLADPAYIPFVGLDLAQFSILGELLPIFENDILIGYVGNFALDFIAAPEAPAEVPEPATLGLLGTGILMAVRRRRAKKN